MKLYMRKQANRGKRLTCEESWSGGLDSNQRPLDGRMRATYSTLMQQAGVDRTIINAMQGRTDNSPVLYLNYLNPGDASYEQSAAAMSAVVAGA